MLTLIAMIQWIESIFRSIPLPVLEIWGRVSYVLGLILAFFAFTGFTFRPNGSWGFARERQTWDAKALWSATLTFVLVPLAGWVGSGIVLIPGAQTLESLKDLMVCLCILLFGYPALLVIPPAYMLSDMIEGVPLLFIQDWFFGYFTSRAFFWLLYLFIGKNPDFRYWRTWRWYLAFVVMVMLLDPQQWGYICSDKFTAEISYRAIPPALFVTLCITWTLVPFAMLGALPLARKLNLFWADIPNHVSERLVGQEKPIWVSGVDQAQTQATLAERSLPVRMLLAAPLIALILSVVGVTAYLTLKSAESTAEKLASRLHQEVAGNINLQLDGYLENAVPSSDAEQAQGLNTLLHSLAIAKHGRAFIIDRSGQLIASSFAPSAIDAAGHPLSLPSAAASGDPVFAAVSLSLKEHVGRLETLGQALQLRVDVITAKPLARDSWLTQATPYVDKHKEHTEDWILITAMPNAYYLEGVFTGNSQAALVIACAVTVSLILAGLLSILVTEPLRRIARASHAMATGDLSQRVAGSRIEELDTVARAFNEMAERLQASFHELLSEVDTRKQREHELRQSDARARQSEERLQLATRAAGLGIWDWDVTNNQLVWDDAMHQLYGIPREAFSGTVDAWAGSLLAEDHERAMAEVNAALQGERELDTEFRIRWPDGSIHHIKGVAQTIRDSSGSAVRMVGINYDITSSAVAEQELIQHRNHLEELVNERTAALSVAVGRAEAASRAKSTFLANMSHELRTPMNAILGFSGLMQRDPTITAAQRENLSIINKSGEHLLMLINNVLDMSKIEAGRMELQDEPFDLLGMLRDIADMLRGQAQEKGLTLSLDVSPSVPGHVRSDESKLRQIIVNLLGNALRHTADGGVTMRLDATPVGEHERLSIEIEDTGMGMLPDDLARIFEPFVQGGRQATQSGTGLGLAISQEYAKMMGGQITVASTPGLGTTFRVDVQVALATMDSVPAPASLSRKVLHLAPGQPEWRVLVVEDQADNRLLLKTLLSRIGFQVQAAADGVQAVEIFRQWQPHLIWMDQRMPEMDGREATRQIRRLPGGLDVKIIAVSASVFTEERAEILSAGMDGFIRKPYHAEEIYDCLAKQLGVCYEYDEGATPAETTLHSPALLMALDALPAALRQGLEEALLSLDAERIDAVIGQVSLQADELGKVLAHHANNFDYAAILNALQSSPAGAAP